MLKTIIISSILSLNALSLSWPKRGDLEPGTVIFSQDFNAYDGSGADSYAWHHCGMICDAATKDIIKEGENIEGYSLKAGGNGYCASNALLAIQANAIPFVSKGEGIYTTEFDLRLTNASSFGFQYLTVGTDKYLAGVSFNPNDLSNTKASSSRYFSVDLLSEGYYHVSFDYEYRSGDIWGYFYGNFSNGYIVVDNVKVSVSSNDYSGVKKEKDFTGYKYSQTFQSYDGTKPVDSFLWNDLGWASDAESKMFIDSFDDPEAITNLSLKVGQSKAGAYRANQVFCSRGASENPFHLVKGKWTIELDVRLHNVSEFVYCLKTVNTDVVISKITFNPSDLGSATSTSRFYKAIEEGGVIHVEVDALTSDGNNWSDFGLTFGEGGGYMVIDNIAVKESLNDYSADIVLFNDDFESYESGNVPAYLFHKTHLYSDSPNLSIEEGFDGKAVTSRTNEGTYMASSFLGLQGSNGPGAMSMSKGELYEISFDFASVNVTVFSFHLKYFKEDKGDLDLLNISIDPKAKSFSSNVSADVKFNESHNHSLVQFKALETASIFGYFAYSSLEGGVVRFDNFRLTALQNMTLPLFQSTFEEGRLAPFKAETKRDEQEEILSKVTNENGQMINGGYSAICGFNRVGSALPLAKFPLLKAEGSFDESHSYLVRFRFKILSSNAVSFYVALAHNEELSVSFDESGITAKGEKASGSVVAEEGHYLLEAKFDPNVFSSFFELGSYGDGTIVIDDITISQGTHLPSLPSIEKKQLEGREVFNEGFENQTPGEHLKLEKFISGVDVFSYRYVYNEEAINGAVSLSILSGSAWGAQIRTLDGVLSPGHIYTAKLRYKALAKNVGNLTFIVQGEKEERYIALTKEGKVSPFNYDGREFFQGIDLAKASKVGSYCEASITFFAPNGNPRLILGTYGVSEFSIDDITLFDGGVGEFKKEVEPIASANRDELAALIRRCQNLPSSKYEEEGYLRLLGQLKEAEKVWNDLAASQEEINEAAKALQASLASLVLKEAKLLREAIAAIKEASTRKDRHEAILRALRIYHSIEDKESVTDLMNALRECVNEYNQEVALENKSMDYNNLSSLATALFPFVSLSLLILMFLKGGFAL